MDPRKVDAIVRWPPPTNVVELQTFLGLAGFYHKCIKNYAKIVVPMMNQLRTKGHSFVWGEAQQQSFDQLKVALATAPVLAIVYPNQPFLVELNASEIMPFVRCFSKRDRPSLLKEEN